MKPFEIASCLVVYGLAHALVDASCLLLLLGGIDVGNSLLTYVVLYNLLAFGLQLPFGFINDRLHLPVATAVLGCILLSASIMLFMYPLFAIIIAGTGNALFHTGGGTVALNLKPGKAALPGVFVAPGGVGLFAGGLILKVYGFHPLIMAISLLIMAIPVLLIKTPRILYSLKAATTVNYLDLAILLLMVTVCIRSIVGLSIDFTWKSDINLLIALTAAIALGKGLGGFLADYFGWIRIAVGGLIISALLMLFGPQLPLAGLAGLFFFNLTMPVTLVAISNQLPGRPGFSFGLTTFAMIAGALPTFFPSKALFVVSPVLVSLIIISAITLYTGLKIIQPRTSLSKTIQP